MLRTEDKLSLDENISYDLSSIRQHFPIFEESEREVGRPLAYLDTAASSQKPREVIDNLSRSLLLEHANIHRGAYSLSARATERYEAVRLTIAKAINARSDRSIIFTRGTTESVNLAARSLEGWFNPGDVIVLTMLEHHSNIVPWQLLAERRGLKVVFAAIKEDASLDLDDFIEKVRTLKPRLVSFSLHSNAFGTVTPVDDMVAVCREVGAVIFHDAAQAIVHGDVDVQRLDSDFLAFSGHKVYGPTGAGILYVRPEMYRHMEPFMGGGDMISSVTIEGSTWAEPPQKFEAGTPAIAEVLALGAAVEFVDRIGRKEVQSYEQKLFLEAWELLRKEGLTLYGPANNGGAQSSIIPFNVPGVHPHDIATIADTFNVQLRAGNHCAMPALRKVGLYSTVRASIGVYTQLEDFEQLVDALRHARKILS